MSFMKTLKSIGDSRSACGRPSIGVLIQNLQLAIMKVNCESKINIDKPTFILSYFVFEWSSKRIAIVTNFVIDIAMSF